MFTNISWTAYLAMVTIGLVIYYGFIAAKYYGKEIRELVSGQRLSFGSSKKQLEPQVYVDNYTEEKLPLEFNPEPELADVEVLIDKLRDTIADQGDKVFLKSEFLEYISLVLAEYPAVGKSPYRKAVNEFVVSECSKRKTVALSESEVNVLWEA